MATEILIFNDDFTITTGGTLTAAEITTNTLRTEFIKAGKIIADFGEAMGYNSEFELSYSGDQDAVNRFESFYMFGNNTFGAYDLNPCNSEDWELMKWYDYVDDMVDLSKGWPDLMFVLKRAGEESGDLSMTWFKNGKIWAPKVKITFEAPPEGYFD